MPSKLAITSMSLGRCYAGHTLTHKLDMAHKHGYQGLELFHEDLADVAYLLTSETPSPSGPSPPAQLLAARQIRRMCQARNIEIICLQPFSQYDGLVNREEHNRRLEQLDFWIDLAHELGTDMIQIPANFLPAEEVTEDMDLIVSDLREVADRGLRAEPKVRFVYEALCWSTRVDTWEKSWEVVERVDRENFGVCLDTFNIAGRIFADPTVMGGCKPGGEEEVRKSMGRLVERVRREKVFYVQVVDAERLGEALVEGHEFWVETQPARMSWSRNCRLFYGEGGYLPVKEIAWAIFKGLGFEGWVSLELFNRRMGERGGGVVEELARRGRVSWGKLVRDMKICVEVPVREREREREQQQQHQQQPMRMLAMSPSL
ncbi:xylose isomerase-like protein [Triangularia verruculosa]|uniref:Xylose isomerase-like protein n=1 Tax=Triangularia verruculosa TaxID=2587418 RepID=A0AAN6XJG4_9PEZI|nr:xylose isomerase-like protein [Triangularia verruculosa]